jgi:hypothetical protein
MSAALGPCGNCGRIANARLSCPCGSSVAYCSSCAQWGMRTALEHVLACERGALATTPAPAPLGVPCLDGAICAPSHCVARLGWCSRRDALREVRT